MATARSFTPDFDNPYVQTLASGLAWTPGDTVTFHLGPSDVDGDGPNDWDQAGGGDGIRAAYALWGAVVDLTFKEVRTEAAADWTERVVVTDGFSGTHYLPFDSRGSGEGGEYNSQRVLSGENAPGGKTFFVYVHEIGHGIGLDHTHEEVGFPGVDGPQDRGDNGLNQQVFSAMSYVEGWDGAPNRSLEHGWVAGPMAFDIAAAQAIYGANTETATGNDVYRLPSADGPGAFFTCIWDAGGVETVRAGGGGRGATVDLRAATLENAPGGGGYVSRVEGVVGGFTIAHGVVIENAVGGEGRDRITGNEARNVLSGAASRDDLNGGAGADRLFGGDGADRLGGGTGRDALQGGLGADLLTGGAERDTFVYGATGESAGGAVDRIADFAVRVDDIDLRRIDWSAAAGDQAFTFVPGPLTAAGQVHARQDRAAGVTIVEAEVDGDPGADLAIRLDGLLDLRPSDFLL